MVGPDDFHALQDYLVAQRGELQASVDAAAKAGNPVDLAHIRQWGDLAAAIEGYSLESHSFFTPDAQYARGQGLSQQLATFRTYLESIQAPDIPPVTPPPPVAPKEGLLGDAMGILELVAIIMVLREFK